MSATAQIIIEVDDHAAVQSVKRLGDTTQTLDPALQKVGQRGNVVLTDIADRTTKAREAAQLFAHVTGVQMPRALESVLAKTSLIGPALGVAFNGVVILAAAQAAISAASALGDYIAKVRDAGVDHQALFDSVVKTNSVMQGPRTYAEAAKNISSVETRIESLRNQLGLTSGFISATWEKVQLLFVESVKRDAKELAHLESILPGLQDQFAALADAEKRTQPVEVLKLQNQARLEGLLGIAKSNAAEVFNTEVIKREVAARMLTEKMGQANITEEHAKAAAARRALELNLTNQLRDLHSQAVNAQLSGIALMEAQEVQEIQKAHDQLVEQGLRGVQLTREFEKEKAEIVLEFTNKKIAYRISEDDATRQLAQQAVQSYLGGVEAEKDAEKDAEENLKVMLDRKLIDQQTYEQRLLSIRQISATRLLDLERQRADEEKQLETEAAISSLPPWQRADAQIVADAEARIQKIRELEDKDRTFREQGEREVSAIMQKEWNERIDNMASQIENLFDDIASGNIKQVFMKMFKHMLAEMVAAWILGMNQMRSASQQTFGGGGGILGAIFGSLGLGGLGGIFGGGGGGGGQGGIGSIPGVITNLFGGGNGVAFGGTPGGFNNLFGAGGSALGNLPLGTSSDFATLGALGASAGLGIGAPGSTLPSGAGTSAGLGGGLLGKLFSHNIGSLSGSLLGTAGLSLLFGSIGKGGIGGALGGAAGGALTGFAVGGPIGAVIGGIIGFFSGLFGHSTKKARLAIEAQIKDQSQKLEDAYNTFQIDFTSVNSQLESLRTQGVDALKQAGVKDISRSRVGHVDHWVDKAEKEIAATEAERQKRAAIIFGPAQFRTGGFVSPSLAKILPEGFGTGAMQFAMGGAVPAILHPYEYVMRPEAVRQHGLAKLERMNAGGAEGDTHFHITINAIDSKSFDSYLTSGGTKSIISALSRARNEGGF